MMQIQDQYSGALLRRTLTVRDYDNGTTEFGARVVGPDVEAYAVVAVNPQELTQLIDHLIYAYNRYVDAGIVDTEKYPDPMSM